MALFGKTSQEHKKGVTERHVSTLYAGDVELCCDKGFEDLSSISWTNIMSRRTACGYLESYRCLLSVCGFIVKITNSTSDTEHGQYPPRDMSPLGPPDRFVLLTGLRAYGAVLSCGK